MQTTRVPGRNNKHKVVMYAISTCGWCKRTKNFLRDNNIEYEYVDIDLCKTAVGTEKPSKIKMKMWYCKQCGYVCFREEPPYICPICKAKREMFAEITIDTEIHG